MKFEKTYPEFAGKLSITEDNSATVTQDERTAIVQLENDDEANKLVLEFEDPDGDLMYAEGSIFGKYPALHIFRP